MASSGFLCRFCQCYNIKSKRKAGKSLDSPDFEPFLDQSWTSMKLMMLITVMRPPCSTDSQESKHMALVMRQFIVPSTGIPWIDSVSCCAASWLVQTSWIQSSLAKLPNPLAWKERCGLHNPQNWLLPQPHRLDEIWNLWILAGLMEWTSGQELLTYFVAIQRLLQHWNVLFITKYNIQTATIWPRDHPYI